MKPILTIFTPTYNRAHTLHLCYESLKRQTCKDFIWLIIDDGSSDHTKTLIQKWISEDDVTIAYHYQENMGMHGAHNTAYNLINTELNVCIDSDDYMTDDAVEKINSFWRQYGDKTYAGIIALDATTDYKVIGCRLPQIKSTTLMGFYTKGGTGDKKLIYRTEVIKKYPPYPIFEGEKYVGLNYKYMMIDRDYPLLILDEIVCLVEYQADGSSMNMIHQYRKNPRGFAELRKAGMIYKPGIKVKFKEAIHYISSSIMIKNRRFLKESPRKDLTILAIVPGILLYCYIMHTSKSTIIYKAS
ncbi:glycosyltransferase family 2 protein [Niameybacter massiliensis]|uniref:glycosyltransferase family 2 protein n=1 Tax=Niameybacter massiliensis TaxID=1658108 RepID=UPI0006B586D6|nr:glycosyltransferase family 2 protein [Niameybacter massiliensis]